MGIIIARIHSKNTSSLVRNCQNYFKVAAPFPRNYRGLPLVHISPAFSIATFIDGGLLVVHGVMSLLFYLVFLWWQKICSIFSYSYLVPVCLWWDAYWSLAHFSLYFPKFYIWNSNFLLDIQFSNIFNKSRATPLICFTYFFAQLKLLILMNTILLVMAFLEGDCAEVFKKSLSYLKSPEVPSMLFSSIL